MKPWISVAIVAAFGVGLVSGIEAYKFKNRPVAEPPVRAISSGDIHRRIKEDRARQSREFLDTMWIPAMIRREDLSRQIAYMCRQAFKVSKQGD